MYKLRILSIGKTKEEWLEQALSEYVKRLKSTITVEFVWVKNDAQLIQHADKERFAVCLDPQGQLLTSEQFADFLQDQLQEGGSRLTLIIGGAEGLPDTIKERFPLISLSLLTFTHQIARLVLIEQIYRATEIIKGTGYHK